MIKEGVRSQLTKTFAKYRVYDQCISEVKFACRSARVRCKDIDPMEILDIIRKYENAAQSLEDKTENKKGEPKTRMVIEEMFQSDNLGDYESVFVVKIGHAVLKRFSDHESAKNFVLENAIFDEYAEICDFGTSKECRIFVQDAKRKGYTLDDLNIRSKPFRKPALLNRQFFPEFVYNAGKENQK